MRERWLPYLVSAIIGGLIVLAVHILFALMGGS